MKNKGFTLIELLSVLVILVIVTAITYPLIDDTIEKQRKKAFKNSIEGIMRSTEERNAASGFKVNAIYTFNTDLLTLTEENGETPTSSVSIETSGKMENGTGNVYINATGELAIVISNGKWCGIKRYNEKEVTVIDYSQNTCNFNP